MDDHPLTRAGIVELLESSDSIRPVGAAADGQQALDLVRHAEPDVVVMDVSMPGMSGIEATRRLVAERPSARVLLHSAEASPTVARAGQAAGAAGLIVKSGRAAALVHAIRAVGAGRPVWPTRNGS